jgi:uncharacterized membrane protein
MVDAGPQRDKQFEIFLGQVLRAGFFLSAFVVFAGGVLYLIKYGHRSPQYGIFHGEPSDLRHTSDVVKGAFSGHSRELIELGLLLLILTPVSRVLLSVIEFTRERDWLYVATTVIVLAILIYGLVTR